ncbi:MAG TPA: lysylphosphatidylglycerol synthase domain-containing protein [Pseudolabrys sp.]|nr:lysylphosphatidylglycerol synthase domain-containing protein [Pseudolabrys sp.]
MSRTRPSRRLIDRLALAAMAIVFCAAAFILVHQFSTVSASDVAMHIAALPRGQVFAAVGLTALSYLILGGYDFLAMRYVRRKLPLRSVLFASFTAFALSNNVGVQILSGGSMRYRIYSSYGLGPIEIGAVIVFNATAYALGVITIGGALALIETPAVSAITHLPETLIVLIGWIHVGVIIAYIALCALWRQPVAFAGIRLRPPSWPLALGQIAVASADAVMAGTVIFVLMPNDLGLAYQSFLAIYLIAATASVLSLVPGGLGVFETAVTVMTAPTSKAAALSAFFVYRIIYFILPLLVALVIFTLHEMRNRRPVA